MEIKSLFAERLKSARIMNGFSLQDLANVLDNKLSRQALHRYEKGAVIPTIEKINLISKALNVSVDYFLRTSPISLSSFDYSKLNNIARKDMAMIIEKTKAYLSTILELEGILGLSHEFDNPLIDFPIITEYKQVQYAAAILREQWELGTGPIPNIVALLEDKNIKLVKLDIATDFNGLHCVVNGTIPVIAYQVRKANDLDTIRTTLLYEVAHLILKFGNITEREKENLCQQFSEALLLPEKAIKTALGMHRTKLSTLELEHLKKRYGISMPAIVRRAKACNLINDHYAKQLIFLLNQRSWANEDFPTDSYTEASNRFEQLLFRALFENQIPLSKAADLSAMSLAEFKTKYLSIF